MTPAAVEPDVAGVLARAGVCRLLARALVYPSEGLLEHLRVTAATVAVAPGVSPELRVPLAELAAAARAGEAPALAEEFVELFHRGVRCPPYEGAYGLAPQMAGKGALLADVAGFYAAFGLAPGGAPAETEDHAGAELEFMSALALKEAHALAAGDADGVAVVREAQVAFLRDHLGGWAPAFAAELAAAAGSAFYGAAARALTAWVEAEVARLGVAPPRMVRLAPPAGEAEPFACPMAPDPAESDPEAPAAMEMAGGGAGEPDATGE